MNITKIARSLSNIWMPITCGMCRQLVPQRTPLCLDCVARIDPIATIDISLTRTRSIPVAAAAAYDGDIVRHVLAKHHADPVAAEELGWLMRQRCYGVLKQVDAVVPVPLHWRRYAQRGFDQADIIARRVAKEMNIYCIPALSRQEWRGSQAGRTPEERHANVKNVFTVTSAAQRLRGLRVAIVDDVLASGATMCAAARTLERASCFVAAGVVVSRVV